jgi:hypothetical protein
MQTARVLALAAVLLFEIFLTEITLGSDLKLACTPRHSEPWFLMVAEKKAASY